MIWVGFKVSIRAMVAPNPVIQNERYLGPFQLEGTYTVGFEVDELKPHLTPDKDRCTIRRGTVESVSNRGREAKIRCGCGTLVKEAV